MLSHAAHSDPDLAQHTKRRVVADANDGCLSNAREQFCRAELHVCEADPQDREKASRLRCTELVVEI
jgi:hypothetical protein